MQIGINYTKGQYRQILNPEEQGNLNEAIPYRNAQAGDQ